MFFCLTRDQLEDVQNFTDIYLRSVFWNAGEGTEFDAGEVRL